jgi:hypothetical protein
MEAAGYSRWFERPLAELGFELWIGDPAEIKTKRVKKRKTDHDIVMQSSAPTQNHMTGYATTIIIETKMTGAMGTVTRTYLRPL